MYFTERNHAYFMKKTDVMLLAVILALGVIGILILIGNRDAGACVSITENGEVIGIYALDKDCDVLIETEDGGSNLLRIAEGKASVVSADCHNQDCVEHKAVSQSGESIICLPHKIVITVYSTSDDKDMDAVAY